MQNREQMHPQDVRNLIIFAVLSISMWLGYDHFIARPHAEQMRAVAVHAKQIAASAPAEILDTAIVKPRPEIVAETGRVKIESKSLAGSINLKGARLDDVVLKDYYKTTERTDRVEQFSPARTPHPRYVETGWTGTNGLSGLPDSNTLWTVKGNDTLTPSTPVTLTTTVSGVTFEKTFSLDEDFGFTITDRVINKTGNAITLYPFALATEHGLPEDFLNLGVIHEGPIAYVGEDLEERTYKKLEKNRNQSFTANTGWVGLTGKYWLTALASANQNETTRFRFILSPAVDEKTKDRYQADLTGAAREIAAGGEGTYAVHLFAGPKKLKLLETYEDQWGLPHFDLAVDFGWFYFLTKPFFLILNWLYGLVGNFGIAIIIFTCCLRLLIFPLANTSYRSFAALRKISPEMYDIRHKYKDDRAQLQQELVKLYQKNNVNPMAGCLPIIVQIPIFFSLYKVLSNTIEMRHAPFYGWIHDLSAKDPTSFINLFGLLPFDAPSFLHVGAWPCMMLIGMIIQKHISPPPDDPIQARLIAIMPWFMTYIMSGFASGLVIYWTVNNILAVIQQMVIMKTMGVPIHLFSKDKDKAKLKKEIEEGPVVHPKLEMIEEEIEDVVHEGEAKIVSKPKPKKKKKK